MELRVLSLYPDQMNIYADRGNILFLQRRCEWRKIAFVWKGAGPGESVDPAEHDLFYIGGGQDRDQRAVAADLVETKQAALAAAVDDGAALLAVCGGYQLLGESYQLGEETLPGLGLADLRTVREEGPRLIGNVAIETELGGEKRLLAGFENHGGRTYLHGPLLPKNAWLADHLIELALERRYGERPTLEPLADELERAAHASARAAAGV
jgi:lipid II isoglutaminyl synthase (glutamine-hydrolysing)